MTPDKFSDTVSQALDAAKAVLDGVPEADRKGMAEPSVAGVMAVLDLIEDGVRTFRQVVREDKAAFYMVPASVEIMRANDALQKLMLAVALTQTNRLVEKVLDGPGIPGMEGFPDLGPFRRS